MKKIFNKLFFPGPMSWGDGLIHTGIVHYYGDRCDELHFPVYPNQYDTFKTLYQEHPNIIVVPLMPHDMGEDQYVYENKLSRILRSEILSVRKDGTNVGVMWDLQIYANYELPYHIRYSNFRLPKHIDGSKELYEKLTNGKPYILFHSRSGDFPEGAPINLQGFREFNGLPMDVDIIDINESITDNLMHYVDLIKNASEIHCVPSSFFILVDSIHDKTKAKLFYHDIRKTTDIAVNSGWNNYPWTIISYDIRF